MSLRNAGAEGTNSLSHCVRLLPAKPISWQWLEGAVSWDAEIDLVKFQRLTGLSEDSPLPRSCGFAVRMDGNELSFEPVIHWLTLSLIHCPSEAVSGAKLHKLKLFVCQASNHLLLGPEGVFWVWVFQNVMDKLGLLERIQWVKEGGREVQAPCLWLDP